MNARVRKREFVPAPRKRPALWGRPFRLSIAAAYDIAARTRSGRQRRAADAHAGGVEHRIGDRRRQRPDRRLAGAGRRQVGMVDRDDVDRARASR